MFKKNQKNRAFLSAVAMIALSAIVITTASFAWFTLGRNAMASNLDLMIQKQGEGIEISANTNSFTDVLTFEDLNGTATTGFQASSEDYNYFPAEIRPASTSFALNTLPAFYAGGIGAGIGDDGSIGKFMNSAAATSANGVDLYGKDGVTVPSGADRAGFYAFDVFIKYTSSTGTGTAQVKVGESSLVVKTKDADDDAEATDGTDAATNAMRIGFVNCGTVTAGSTAQASSGSAAVIYANNEAARDTKPVTSAGKSAALADGAVTVAPAEAGSLTIASAYDCPVETGATDQTLTLESGINRVRVYIWMEGQDANCKNELQSQLVSANLVFSLV